MEADNIIYAALKTLGLSVARGFYKVSEKKDAPPAYMTYQLIARTDIHFADDSSEATQTTWRVDLYSRSNYTDTIQAVVCLLKDAEFYGVTVEAEQYEQDTGYYHISFEAKYLTLEE